jgi:L-ectoine synthase
MIVRRLQDLAGGEREVDTPNWVSRMEYRHHLEAVYCIEGSGSILDAETGTRHRIKPGTVYALDKHDKHVLEADPGRRLRMICVFNPPVTGGEVHDETGAYPVPQGTEE